SRAELESYLRPDDDPQAGIAWADPSAVAVHHLVYGEYLRAGSKHRGRRAESLRSPGSRLESGNLSRHSGSARGAAGLRGAAAGVSGCRLHAGLLLRFRLRHLLGLLERLRRPNAQDVVQFASFDRLVPDQRRGELFQVLPMSGQHIVDNALCVAHNAARFVVNELHRMLAVMLLL